MLRQQTQQRSDTSRGNYIATAEKNHGGGVVICQWSFVIGHLQVRQMTNDK
jgi:hypothetical protein